ncbi:HAD hydrolase-like protein [Rhizobium sp. Pop5]|uniref:HAD hydrolase-like protein n=1 Tax=Rhizobium sp. Pop5 TaxID=1223565 RepID=UPI0002834CC7|nr:HAD hydrolase-like protein [Rhizobium sp. Pop5]EJZ17687.1 putative phosphoglycolate phosphatase [Rhizobium sp. Pop5]UVD55829.1 HAD hydrolase-like protein [Rhizobium sp. Pop5]
MRHDLAIFDFDGTLADSGEWFSGSLNDVADRFGFRRTTIEEREALRHLGNREIIQKLRVPMWKMPAIAAYMRRRATEDIESIRLFEGVAPALTMLRQRGIKLAIVSSNTEQNVRVVLGPELAELINFYGCGSSIFGKAVKFRGAMKQLGTAPERTICVGDETRDIEAAKAVGASSAAVTWGYAAPESLRRLKPTLVLEQVHELERLAG